MTRNDLIVALMRFVALHGPDAIRIKCARCGAMTRLEHMAAREMAHDSRLKPICRACETKCNGHMQTPEINDEGAEEVAT